VPIDVLVFTLALASHYVPCPHCGLSLARAEVDAHECEVDRRLDYALFQLRNEVTAFEGELGKYLASPRGRFERWYAERARRRDVKGA
jgi:hypothetical protein